MSVDKMGRMTVALRYKCPFCEWELNTVSGAKRHMLKKHGIRRLYTVSELAEIIRGVEASERIRKEGA